MRLSVSRLACGIVGGFAFAMPASAVPTTILSETFSGSNANNLAGTTADIGGTWTGSTNFKEGGQVTGTGTAYVPVTIAPGSIYTLSADLAPTPGGTTNWLAVGFTSTAGGGGASINSDGGTAYAWMLLRDNGNIQAFRGANTANLGPSEVPVGNPSNLRVVLDTTNAANYFVQFFDENTAVSAPTGIGAPSLSRVAISSYVMTGSIDNVTLTQEVVKPVHGLLLSDDFTTVGTPSNADLNYNLANRQDGQLAPITYRRSGNAQVGNTGASDKTILDGGNVLLLAGGATATLNRNFNGALTQGTFKIEFDAAPDVRSGTSGNPVQSTDWVAINLGANPSDTPGVNAALTHFGLLIRENGQFQAFDGSTSVGSGVMDATPIENGFYRDIMLLITDPTDGNAFNGVGQTTISAFYEGNLFYTFTKFGGGYANNYINFQGNTIGYVDNLEISLIVPEPATMSLLGLGGLALLRRRRVA